MKQQIRFIFLCLSFLLLAQTATMAFTWPADSLRHKKVNGIRVKLYKVLPKDSWSSISRKTRVSLAYLKSVNSGIENLKPGQIVNIPLEEDSRGNESGKEKGESMAIEEAAVTVPAKESKYQEPVYHTIKKGETLFKVSKQYNQTVENIKEWNRLRDNNLKSGQKLIVNYIYKYRKTVPESASVNKPMDDSQKKNSTSTENSLSGNTGKETTASPQPASLTASSEGKDPVISPSAYSTTSHPGSSNGRMIRQVQETGVAAWIMDGELNQNKYYALHRSAPVGTIIKVTNRMNGRYVFVKVVGLLPDSGDNDNLIIKISQAASNKINVLDSRFQAELGYGVVE